MRSAIIIHGAWHQPDHYVGVTRLLRQRGVDVHVPDIGPMSVRDGIGRVQQIVEDLEHPPVVVAHSFGGVAASGLRRVGHLLFVAAWVLDATETSSEWVSRVAEETGAPDLLMQSVQLNTDGQMVIDQDAATTSFYSDCTSDQAHHAVKLLRPESIDKPQETPRGASWREAPSTYVVCEQDHALRPEYSTAFAQRCATTKSLPTGHVPFISAPGLISDLIYELANEPI